METRNVCTTQWEELRGPSVMVSRWCSVFKAKNWASTWITPDQSYWLASQMTALTVFKNQKRLPEEPHIKSLRPNLSVHRRTQLKTRVATLPRKSRRYINLHRSWSFEAVYRSRQTAEREMSERTSKSLKIRSLSSRGSTTNPNTSGKFRATKSRKY